MISKFWLALPMVLLFCSLMTGCGNGNATVQPSGAEPVPADAPVGEEKPSTDEM